MSEQAYPGAPNGHVVNAREAFFVDDSEVPHAFPGVARIIELASGENFYSIATEIKDAVEEQGPMPTRKQRRAGYQGANDALVNVIDTVSNAIMAEGHDDVRAATRRMIGGWFLNGRAGKSALDVVSVFVDEQVAITTDSQAASDESMAEITQLIADNPLAQYELAKIFAADITIKNGFPAGLALLVSSQVSDESLDGKPVHEKIRTSLGDGDYDEYIVRDVLDFYDTAGQDINGSFGKIRSLETFLAHAFAELPASEIRKRMVTTTDNWPHDMKAALAKLRNELKSDLERNIQTSRNVTRDLKPGSTGTVEQVMQEFSAVSNNYLNKTNHHARPAGAARTSSAKRRQSPKREPVEQPEPTFETETNIVRPLELLTASGERFAEDSSEFQALVSGYLAKYPGAPGLKQLVENSLLFMSRLDMSKGLVGGIKKLNDPIKRGDGKLDLFELKPSEVPGLSTRTKRGQALRVYFSFDPTPDSQTILLHAMADRSQQSEVERKLRVNYTYTNQ